MKVQGLKHPSFVAFVKSLFFILCRICSRKTNNLNLWSEGIAMYTYNQGLYIMFQMTGNECAALLQNTHLHFAIVVTDKKNSQAVRSYRGCVLETATVVDLTTESASVRASTVDYSGSTLYWKQD